MNNLEHTHSEEGRGLSRREACGILATGVLAAISLDMRKKAQSLEKITAGQSGDQDMYDEDEGSSGADPNAMVTMMDNVDAKLHEKCTVLAKSYYRKYCFRQDKQYYEIDCESEIAYILMDAYSDLVEQIWNEYVAIIDEYRGHKFVFGRDGDAKRYSFKQIGSKIKKDTINMLIEKHGLKAIIENELQSTMSEQEPIDVSSLE